MSNNTPFPPGSLVCGYIRDSGGDTQELSAKQQENYMRKWCNDHGLVLTQVFIDASSGTTTRGRDHFDELINYFQTDPPIAGLLIWRHNRFARNVPDAQYYKGDIRRRGYIIHSLMDNIPQGTFQYVIETLEDTYAQKKSEELSEDVQRGLHDNLLDFHTLGGFPPKGFKRQPVKISTHRDGKPHMSSKWVPDPELVPIIQKAWVMRAAGATYGQIKKATNLFRSINSFTTFFRNKLYIGTLVFGNTTIDDYCQPIIDRATWDAVQKINHKNHRDERPPRQRKSQSPYTLSGLLTCGICGSPLSGTRIRSRDRKIYPYYRCTQRNRNRDCTAQSIPQKPLENHLLDIIVNQLLTPDSIADIQRHDANNRSTRKTAIDAEINALKSQHGPLQRKINNIIEAIADAGHTQVLLTALSDLEKQSRDLQSQISVLEAQIPPPIDTPAITPNEINSYLRKALEKSTPTEKRAILNSFITSISIIRTGDKATGTIQHTPPLVINDVKKKPPKGGNPRLAYSPNHGGGTYTTLNTDFTFTIENGNRSI